MIDRLRYPIGKVKIPNKISEKDIRKWITIIENHPDKIINLVAHLNDDQLNTCYRKNGWTIRQVIHHLGDSHTNSYIRFKWTLTENQPIIKSYYEDRWAELDDTKNAPIQQSLVYLKALHIKWVYLLKILTVEDLQKIFIHPETNESVTLAKNIGIYAWHCQHHFEHINQLMIHNNWK